MQVINPGESALGRLGTALGGGLSSGLQNLAQMKLQQLQRRQQQQRNETGLRALDYSQEKAAGLSQLDNDLLKEVLKTRGSNINQADFLQAISELYGQQPTNNNGDSGVGNLMQSNSPGIIEAGANGALSQSESLLPQQGKSPISSTPKNNIADILANKKNLTPDQVTKLTELSLKKDAAANNQIKEKEKESRIEQHNADKETAPFLEEIEKKRTIAEKGLERNKRWGDLIARGESPGSTMKAIQLALRLFGRSYAPDVLRDPTSTEFKGLITDALINEVLPKFKGLGTLSDTDIREALKRYPDLLNTDGGNSQLLYQLNSGYYADEAEAQALDRVLAKYGGRRPASLSLSDFKKEVRDESKPDLARIANDFKYGPFKYRPPQE